MKNYLRLIKFSHTIFALPFSMIGFFLGIKSGYQFEIEKLFFVLLCMVSARSAAMAFNRYIDADFDSKNNRTIIREIPQGIITKKNALIFTIISSLVFVFSSRMLNSLCFYLSPIALLVILGYSYTKRFTSLCHLILGIGLALAPIGSYIAVTEHFSLEVLTLGASVLFWVAGFDIIYALQDEEFDKSQSLKSIPVWLGKNNALLFSRLLHFISYCFLIFSVYLVYQKHEATLSLPTMLALILFLGLLIYQHSIVKPNDLSKVNLAFFTMNGIASVVFGTLLVFDILF